MAMPQHPTDPPHASTTRDHILRAALSLEAARKNSLPTANENNICLAEWSTDIPTRYIARKYSSALAIANARSCVTVAPAW